MNIEKDIKFAWIDKYTHSYYVPGLHDRLTKYQGLFDKEFEHGYRPPQSANSTIINKDFDRDFQMLFYNIIKHYYLIDEPWFKTNFGVYRQIHNDNVSVYHNHIRTSVIIAVTYLNPPLEGEGGGLSLWDIPYDKKELLPEKDVIYTFPGWMLHKPLPQTTTTPRYSVNWGIDSSRRPIHKLTGDRW